MLGVTTSKTTLPATRCRGIQYLGIHGCVDVVQPAARLSGDIGPMATIEGRHGVPHELLCGALDDLPVCGKLCETARHSLDALSHTRSMRRTSDRSYQLKPYALTAIAVHFAERWRHRGPVLSLNSARSRRAAPPPRIFFSSS